MWGVSGTTDQDTSTRQRILDIAADLFVEQGYEKTSLREIAERLGYSKAAIYYHFPSKEDILLEIHLQVHAFGADLLGRMPDRPDADAWLELLGQLVDKVLSHRTLFLLHERNRTAVQALHDDERHTAEHDDLEDAVRVILRNTAISLDQRVRLAGAIAMATVGVVLFSNFEDVPTEEYAGAFKAALRDLLRPAGRASRGKKPAGRASGR